MPEYIYLIWEDRQEDPLCACKTEKFAELTMKYLHIIDEIMEFPSKNYWWTKMPLCDSGNHVRRKLN